VECRKKKGIDLYNPKEKNLTICSVPSTNLGILTAVGDKAKLSGEGGTAAITTRQKGGGRRKLNGDGREERKRGQENHEKKNRARTLERICVRFSCSREEISSAQRREKESKGRSQTDNCPTAGGGEKGGIIARCCRQPRKTLSERSFQKRKKKKEKKSNPWGKGKLLHGLLERKEATIPGCADKSQKKLGLQ